MEKHCVSGEQLLLQLLGQPTQEGPTKGKKRKLQEQRVHLGISDDQLISFSFSLKGKVPNKQDDSWIMTHLIKQLTDMGFPVSTACHSQTYNFTPCSLLRYLGRDVLTYFPWHFVKFHLSNIVTILLWRKKRNILQFLNLS